LQDELQRHPLDEPLGTLGARGPDLGHAAHGDSLAQHVFADALAWVHGIYTPRCPAEVKRPRPARRGPDHGRIRRDSARFPGHTWAVTFFAPADPTTMETARRARLEPLSSTLSDEEVVARV